MVLRRCKDINWILRSAQIKNYVIRGRETDVHSAMGMGLNKTMRDLFIKLEVGLVF
jgi:hypothetical protein